ncbi:MFS transporter [Pseudomonas syringae group genomosp. 3]|uniref:MFS transporter n=1 Tax=Pseudomonas syringae group genomosp. 3 TaxID=251701 RepID=A0ABD6VCJ4_9PSED|nr:MFS transporter [Pseudomonas syringae group genomosp. 3]KPW53717.1 Major facilitator family transporter [Pseudomonas syringae pv. berberidis]KPY10380.1 Major facilitator family transporter [Pseudomonas syringae pv. philadelphi]POD69842.1 MFS transporter [Pseudomonas syringae group genomosp. 3]RMM31365.1 Major facilitator family transporter [Pseudomonas syringae pv. berberidis]RMP66430.1 Major facilitator family transporter [Pseudomonas syringae pv. berberidis]
MAMGEEQGEKLPLGALLALAMTGFICIVTETLPAGLLPEIGTGLGVSASFAGQMVTVYALGSLLAAIPLTIATQSWRRRTVLLLTIIGFLVFNSVTALSSDYWLTLVARFFAGVSAGLAWSLIAGYARRMVVPQLQGRALAIAMVGTPIALSLGVPLGTWLGGFMGWRMAFGLMSAMTLLLIVWVLVKVPDYPGQSSSQRMALRQVFFTPGVRSVLGVVFTWMLAHNILYTYVAPFVSGAGLASDVDWVLLTFGIAALAGIWVTGRLVDRHLRKTVLASLATFAAVSVFLGVFSGSAPAVYVGVFIWGLTFGGAATLLQTALADSAGEGADVALSMNVVVWNSAIAGGGLLGGVLLGHWGVGVFPWVLLVLSVLSLVIALRARVHGFAGGNRLTK